MLKRIVLLSLCLAFSFNLTAAQEGDLAPLLDKITNQLKSHSDDNWTYKVTTKLYEMDKNWKPEKTTISAAVVTDINGELSGELLKAEVIEDGITKDATAEFTKQLKEQIETANKQRTERKGQESPDDSSEVFLPFSENKRAKFAFSRLNDTAIDGRAVFTIEAKAKEEDEQLYEGKFYIDQLTYEVLKAQISPSKNPRFVKEMNMDIDFEVLPEGKFFRRRSRTRVSGGMLFKHFRVIAEEEYSDVKVLD
jgi:hypothetical protein